MSANSPLAAATSHASPMWWRATDFTTRYDTARSPALSSNPRSDGACAAPRRHASPDATTQSFEPVRRDQFCFIGFWQPSLAKLPPGRPVSAHAKWGRRRRRQGLNPQQGHPARTIWAFRPCPGSRGVSSMSSSLTKLIGRGTPRVEESRHKSQSTIILQSYNPIDERSYYNQS